MKLEDINEHYLLMEMAWEDIKLSRPSKMGHIPSWSLQAGLTCPGSTCPTTKETKPACKSCYAKRGNYLYPAAKEVRDKNRKDWKRPDWVDDMVSIIEDYGRFRWFDSGDLYSPELIKKVIEVVKRTPRTQHWIPTMSHHVKKLSPLIDKLDSLPNATVRRSSGEIGLDISPNAGSTIIDKKTAQKMYSGELPIPDNAILCPVGVEPNRKQCKTCRDCYNKEIKTVIYAKH